MRVAAPACTLKRCRPLRGGIRRARSSLRMRLRWANSGSSFLRLGPNLGRRAAVAPAKSAVEVGQIPKSDIECYRGDAPIDKPRIRQNPMGAHKSLAEHIL